VKGSAVNLNIVTIFARTINLLLQKINSSIN